MKKKETPKETIAKINDSIIESFIGKKLCAFNVPTGTGKTHTWAVASLNKLLKHYDQVLFITPQKKLCDEFVQKAMNLIKEGKTKLKESDILYIKSNSDTIYPMYKNGKLFILSHEIESLSELMKKKEPKVYKDFKNLISNYKKAMCSFLQYAELKKDISLFKLIPDSKQTLDIRTWELVGAIKQVINKFTTECCTNKIEILNYCPTLRSVFPQIDFKQTRIIVTNISKSVAGIDLILDNNMTFETYTNDKETRRFIILDESDTCALAIRNFYMSCVANNKEYVEKNYKGVLNIRSLMSTLKFVTKKYNNGELHLELESFSKKAADIWKEKMGNTPLYTDIFLAPDENSEEIERRGTFLVGYGNQIKLYNEQNSNSYICHKKGNDHLTLVHADSKDIVEEKYDVTIGMASFINMCIKIQKSFFYYISEQVKLYYNRRVLKFRNAIEEAKKDPTSTRRVITEPSLESSAYSLAIRFIKQDEEAAKRLSNQIIDYINYTFILSKDKDKQIQMRYKSTHDTDQAMYSQGVKFYYEQLKEQDDLKHINLMYVDLGKTAENTIISLLQGNVTVVLSSATALTQTVMGNFDINYFRKILGSDFYTIPQCVHNKIQENLNATYPKNHAIHTQCIKNAEHFLNRSVASPQIPEYYRVFFHPDALNQGLADWWFKITIQDIKRNNKDRNKYKVKSTDWIFPMARLLQYVEVYYNFWKHNDIRSMIYFQNNKGSDDLQQYTVLSCLIDGSFKEQKSKFIAEESLLPEDWENKHLFILDEWEQVQNKVIPKLEKKENEKILLVTAYNTIKVGCNLQYHAPDNVKVLLGDSWNTNKTNVLKDWDAIYLQEPSNYLTVESNPQKENYIVSRYNALLSLGMFYENGYMTKTEVARWASTAFFTPAQFRFRSDGTVLDKSAWVFAILEQAIGRICRTKNKNPNTYIYYDGKLEKYYIECIENKSMTVEFKAFIDSFNKVDDSTNFDDFAEIRRVKKANMILARHDYRNAEALKYNLMPFEDDIKEEPIPYSVLKARMGEEQLKEIIARHPTIPNYNILTNNDIKICSEIWDDWSKNNDGEYFYHTLQSYKGRKIMLASHNHKDASSVKIISEETTRLKYLMKNQIIHQYFKDHGYATHWDEGLLLNPNILADRYTGKIGEIAAKATFLGLGLCKEKHIKSMIQTMNWEQADIVIADDAGNNKVAFDIKNFIPGYIHEDNERGIPALIKQREKEHRLGCLVVTINMLGCGEKSRDGIREIYGLIDQDGNYIPESINILKNYFI